VMVLAEELPRPFVQMAVRLRVPLEHAREQLDHEPITHAQACALQVWLRSVGAAASQ